MSSAVNDVLKNCRKILPGTKRDFSQLGYLHGDQ